jgi:hypothetical protein
MSSAGQSPCARCGSVVSPLLEAFEMTVSKTKSSFYRRLYVAWLIDTGAATSVPALVEATGMPRRTAQDTLGALVDLDIDCRFDQGDGERHNAGSYRIHDWGAIDRRWIERNLADIKSVLGYP